MAASFLSGLPPCPDTLKPLQHYLKLAKELEGREPVVAYWARYQAVQHGILLDSKSSDSKKFLMSLMDLLERSKKGMPDNDSIRNNIVAQAYIETFAIKLFKWADDQDRSGVQNANVIKAFYQSAVLFDVLEGIAKEQKEPLSEDSERLRKYARWKATYIQKCLRSGEKPISGPIDEQGNPVPTIGAYNDSAYGNRNAGGNGGSNNKPQPLPRANGPTPGSNNGGNDNAYYTDVRDDPSASYPHDLNRQHPGGITGNSTPPPPPRGGVNQRDNNSNIVNPNMSNYAPYPTYSSTGPAGGAVPFYPSNAAASTVPLAAPVVVGGASLTPDLMTKAQKLVKYAGSSLTYDDVPSAVGFLEKALLLLKTGRDVN